MINEHHRSCRLCCCWTRRPARGRDIGDHQTVMPLRNTTVWPKVLSLHDFSCKILKSILCAFYYLCIVVIFSHRKRPSLDPSVGSEMLLICFPCKSLVSPFRQSSIIEDWCRQAQPIKLIKCLIHSHLIYLHSSYTMSRQQFKRASRAPQSHGVLASPSVLLSN